MAKGALRFTLFSLISIGSVIGLIAVGVVYFFLSTPQPKDIRGCITAKMFNVRLCSKDATYVRLGEISPHMRAAVIASEDGAFYSHHGIDWFELRESINRNWEKGEYARGGSTITQQLAKNVYLSAEKSLLRKLREAVIAVQIEKILSKNEILEKYLNVVEFGPGLYGVGRAARFYFGKSAGSLTPAESAFLAFLLPSPKKYSVSFRKQKLSPFARRQMRMIVGRLYALKKIDEFQHFEARDQIDHFFGPKEAPAPNEPPVEEATPSPEELDPEFD
jgi:monofunctional biosynthetic peptidoglycan transglycosylase